MTSNELRQQYVSTLGEIVPGSSGDIDRAGLFARAERIELTDEGRGIDRLGEKGDAASDTEDIKRELCYKSPSLS